MKQSFHKGHLDNILSDIDYSVYLYFHSNITISKVTMSVCWFLIKYFDSYVTSPSRFKPLCRVDWL